MKIDMMKVLSMVAAAGVVVVAGCSQKPETEPARTVGEKTGAALDQAVTKTVEVATNVAEKTTEAVKDAAAATKDVAGQAVEKTGAAVEKAGAAVERTGTNVLESR